LPTARRPPGSSRPSTGAAIASSRPSTPRADRASWHRARCPVVGRDRELEQLGRHLEEALAGQRQIVFVTGDPGIAKTTLVEAFLERVSTRGVFGVARGQCVEQHGPGEAFMPVLEGLERLCRGPIGGHLVSLLREHAPSWLLQLPGLIAPADREALQRQHAGVTRPRMLREMLVGLEALTTRAPIVLVLEDLHWSDPSTLDLPRGAGPATWRGALAGGRHDSPGRGEPRQ
jgi:predicted ATPase